MHTIYYQVGNGIDFSRLPKGYRKAPLVASALAAEAIRAGADFHSTFRAYSSDFYRTVLPMSIQAAAYRNIDRVIANQATAGRRRTDRAIANLAATYCAAHFRLHTPQREMFSAVANREHIDQATTTADQERIDQAIAIQAAADQERIDQATAIQAAADRERVDQARAIQEAVDRERIDQAMAIQAAADQTIAENAEVCLISLQALKKSFLSTVSCS